MTTATAPRSFSAARARRRQRPLVSLTPLIDVVFILLLFFMLASSFAELHSINLDTPARGQGASALQGALLVEVRLDGVRFAGQYVGLEELKQRIRIAVGDDADQRVLVRPAARVSLQDTVRILDALTAAGVSHLSLMDRGRAGR